MHREDQIQEARGRAIVVGAGGSLHDVTQLLEEGCVKLETDDPEAETSNVMEYFDWLAGTSDEELKKLHRELCPGAAHSKYFWQSRAEWRERLGLDVWAAM